MIKQVEQDSICVLIDIIIDIIGNLSCNHAASDVRNHIKRFSLSVGRRRGGDRENQMIRDPPSHCLPSLVFMHSLAFTM